MLLPNGKGLRQWEQGFVFHLVVSFNIKTFVLYHCIEMQADQPICGWEYAEI